MKSPILTACALVLTTLPALADTTWSGTGPRGGTAQGSTACSRATGSVTCQSAGTYTNPFGQTATRSSTRLATPDGVAVTGSTTGPRGRTSNFTRTWSR